MFDRHQHNNKRILYLLVAKEIMAAKGQTLSPIISFNIKQVNIHQAQIFHLRPYEHEIRGCTTTSLHA